MADKSRQTEKPTPRKLEKARQEGQFPVSKEFVNGVQFLVFIWLLSNYGSLWLSNLVATSRIVLERGFQRAGDDEKLQAFGPVIVECMRTAAELAESTDYGR